MTDTRQVLEEAWNAIHDYQKAPWQPLAVGDGMERFRRFLDAEAWTDAALMLVSDWSWIAVRYMITRAMHDIAIAGLDPIKALPDYIAQAALRAQEAGNA